MLQALGFKCLDENGESVKFGGESLLALKTIFMPKDNIYSDIEIKVACDVTNPLLGKNGATYVYGPQKGADFDMMEILEKGLRNYAEILEKKFGFTGQNYLGCGAAGGLGASLMACLGVCS